MYSSNLNDVPVNYSITDCKLEYYQSLRVLADFEDGCEASRPETPIPGRATLYQL